MRFVSYTIYPGGYDTAPGRGHRPVLCGLTVKPTPSLTIQELISLGDEIQSIVKEMQNTKPID